ncbi:ABC transporter substrate-binding protein [Phytohabitans kaempferiae]|uniref:ABC transporter substrate-binding protein n=1 Tax=Phytohabitans kaempferiae TaxID=1620943 RepID=A0ABV6MBC6_9ACTN
MSSFDGRPSPATRPSVPSYVQWRGTMRTPHIAALGLAAAVVVGASACSASAEDSGPISLRMTLWSSAQPHLDLFNSIANDYLSEHPDVKEITFDSLPYEDYLTTLTTQIAGGESPDLAWIPEASSPDFIADSALAPLTEAFRATEGYDYDDILEPLTPLWSQDGQLVAYPFSNSPFMVYVNEDLVAAAGLPSVAQMQEAGDWTWQDLFTAAAQIHAVTGKQGLLVKNFDYQAWHQLRQIWQGWDAYAWSADGKECQFTSPEMVSAFEAIHDAIFVGQAMPGPGTTADFAAGDVAFQVAQISQAAPLANVSFPWSITHLPTGPAGEYAIVGQAGMGVLASGEHVAAATDFLAFLTAPENAAKLAQFFPPPRQSLLTAETLAAANPLIKKEQLQDAVVSQVPLAARPLVHTGWAEIQQTARAALDAMWVPDADVEQVLDATCQAIDPLLEQ